MLAHSPIESPHVLEFGKAVQPNSETFVGLEAEITRIDKPVRYVSLVRYSIMYTDTSRIKYITQRYF